MVLALLMVLVFDTILCLMDSLLNPGNTSGLGFSNGASGLYNPMFDGFAFDSLEYFWS